jgi:membrane dipeptidase
MDLETDRVVWDGHGCLPLVATSASAEGLALYRRSGVDVVSVNVGDSDVALDRQMRLAGCFAAFVRRHPDDYVMVGTVAEVDAAWRSGRLGVVFDVEGAHALGDDIDLVEVYQRIGVRTVALVYNLTNQVGGGCHDAVDGGLTPLGRRLVEALDDVGIVVDCSHAGYRTARDTIEAARGPVVFSHSNPRALVDHPRNIHDELIQACAAKGGVVGINGVSRFLGDNDVNAATIATHIDHVAQLVGAEHVGLGLDYVVSDDDLLDNLAASSAFWPDGFGYGAGMRFAGPDRIPSIVAELEQRGYDHAAINAILGGNLRRIAQTVWRSTSMPGSPS